MWLNQSALSCSGTHFIKPSSWGRGSMRPHIYHTNPSGPSPSCTDSMCVMGARSPDQKTHWLPALIHFHFHLPLFCVKISYLPSSSFSLYLSMMVSISPPSIFILPFLSYPIFLGGGGRCCTVMNAFGTPLFPLNFISLPRVLPISHSPLCDRYSDLLPK